MKMSIPRAWYLLPLLFMQAPWACSAVPDSPPADSAPADIVPAPAFTAADLSQPREDGWLTSGGTLSNQRYSPLQQINRDTVAGVKAVWHTKLNSALEFRHNNQAQPIIHEGVIYMVSGQNDVFALSVDSGEILWEYRSGLQEDEAFVCCQWVSRGVGLGEGKVFVGRLDAVLMALDQRTGEVLWETTTGDPAVGYSLTAAPLYYDGKVIIGPAGGDLGIRGWLRAFDAETGAELWRFNTIPGPGEFGHDTWPADSEVWQWGGGAVWSTPAIDAELGLVYFSTGNPGPSLGGGARPGDNLFTASIVAIDVNTGEYRWHFQEVHHDIWDYDAPNPVILFEAEYNGVMRKGLAQAGKTGWVYILDRITGEPLIGIEETPVMQEPGQATSPTQPFPLGDALVAQEIDVAPEDYRLVNLGRIFTPFNEQARIFMPLAAVNWPPSAYDPATNFMYICANESGNGARMDATQFEPPTFEVSFRGGAYVGAGTPSSGIYTALDLKTNRIVWQKRFNDGCRSGSLVTAGGLVFLGRNDGRVMALDAATGDRLWDFKTDAPVNSGVSTFMHEGRQYLVTYAGGGFLSARKGDGIWLFSLDGTIDGYVAEPPPAAASTAKVLPTNRSADLAKGEATYKAACVYCHGEKGEGGEGGGKSIAAELGVGGIFSVLDQGRNQMPAFGGSMTAEQMHDLASYVLQLRQ
jgi:PQQ-dependent dehydrogenase (methanol/ethanol family)